MKKYVTFSICLLASLIPVLAFGQDQQNYNGLLQFLKGDGAFEKWFMDAFTTLDTSVNAQAAGVAMIGRAIGGFGALCYLGYLGWQMQEGARPWEVTPMIKPLIFALILGNWTSFTGMIQYPLQALAEPGVAIFQNVEQDANDLRVKRFQKQNQLLDKIIKMEADEKAKEQAAEQVASNGINKFLPDIDISGLLSPINEWFIRMDFKIQRMISEVIETVGLTILRVCTYLIFFIQKIWAYILIVLGPIAVGLALIPGFENAFTSWISKFININLYTFITYTIINIGQQLIITGYKMELDRYASMIDDNGGVVNMETLQTFISNNGMMHTVLFPVVAYIVTGIGVLMTPSIADSIVAAGGSGIASKAKAAGSKIFSTGKAAGAAVRTVATGGTTAAADAVAAAKSGVSALKK
jgi:hypothetical protein